MKVPCIWVSTNKVIKLPSSLTAEQLIELASADVFESSGYSKKDFSVKPDSDAVVVFIDEKEFNPGDIK